MRCYAINPPKGYGTVTVAALRLPTDEAMAQADLAAAAFTKWCDERTAREPKTRTVRGSERPTCPAPAVTVRPGKRSK